MHFWLIIFSIYDGFIETKSHHKFQKVCIFYISKEKLEIEIKILFIIESPNMKYEINLAKYVHNCTMKIKKYYWEKLKKTWIYGEILWPWIKGLNMVKMSVSTKLIYSFNEIPLYSSVEVDKLNLKSIWKFNGTRIAKIILKTKYS